MRSGTSVGANYREANRSRTKAEFKSKIGDCLKEIEETEYWLDLLIHLSIFSEPKLKLIRDEAGELSAIFISILRTSAKQTDES